MSVYFLLDRGYQRIKIGTTIQDDRAERQVVAGAGNLVCLGEIEGDRDTELELHGRLARLRVPGKREWFVGASETWEVLSVLGINPPETAWPDLNYVAQLENLLDGLHRKLAEMDRNNQRLRQTLSAARRLATMAQRPSRSTRGEPTPAGILAAVLNTTREK